MFAKWELWDYGTKLTGGDTFDFFMCMFHSPLKKDYSLADRQFLDLLRGDFITSKYNERLNSEHFGRFTQTCRFIEETLSVIESEEQDREKPDRLAMIRCTQMDFSCIFPQLLPGVELIACNRLTLLIISTAYDARPFADTVHTLPPYQGSKYSVLVDNISALSAFRFPGRRPFL